MSKKQKSTEQVEQEQQQLRQYAEQLNKLGTEIEQKDAICIEHGKVALKLAYEAGRILNCVNAMVDWGEWQPWFTENVKTFSLRTGQNYMRLASEEDDRQRNIAYDLKYNDGKTQLVSLLDTCENIRDAYRVIGIIKKEKEDKEKKPTPKEIRNNDPDAYAETRNKITDELQDTVAGVMKAVPKANWDVSQWVIANDGKIRFRGDTGNLLDHFVEIVADHTYKRALVEGREEIRIKCFVVLAKMCRAILKATNKRAPAKSENFSVEFNPKTKKENRRKPTRKNRTPEAVELLRVVAPAAAPTTPQEQTAEEIVTAE